MGLLLSLIPVDNKVDMELGMVGMASWEVGEGEAVVCFLILRKMQEEELTVLAAL